MAVMVFCVSPKPITVAFFIEENVVAVGEAFAVTLELAEDIIHVILGVMLFLSLLHLDILEPIPNTSTAASTIACKTSSGLLNRLKR